MNSWIPPRTVVVPRTDKGFGFTLRKLIVYPPESTVRKVNTENLPPEIGDDGSRTFGFEPLDTVFVKSVRSESSAEKAGLRERDQILAIDGRKITGRTYPQIISFIQKSDCLRLLVMPRDEDLLQMNYCEEHNAHHLRISVDSPRSETKSERYKTSQEVLNNMHALLTESQSDPFPKKPLASPPENNTNFIDQAHKFSSSTSLTNTSRAHQHDSSSRISPSSTSKLVFSFDQKESRLTTLHTSSTSSPTAMPSTTLQPQVVSDTERRSISPLGDACRPRRPGSTTSDGVMLRPKKSRPKKRPTAICGESGQQLKTTTTIETTSVSVRQVKRRQRIKRQEQQQNQSANRDSGIAEKRRGALTDSNVTLKNSPEARHGIKQTVDEVTKVSSKITSVVSKTIKRIGSTMKEGATYSPTGFGTPLEQCLHWEENEQIPLIIPMCCRAIEARGLDSVGVYRVPGNKAAVTQLQEEFKYKGLGAQTNSRWTDINVVSSLLKSFCNSLPEPLITTECSQEILPIFKTSPHEERMKVVKKSLHDLPQANFETLKYMIRHLKTITDHEAANKCDWFFDADLNSAVPEDDTQKGTTDQQQPELVHDSIRNPPSTKPSDSESVSMATPKQRIAKVQSEEVLAHKRRRRHRDRRSLDQARRSGSRHDTTSELAYKQQPSPARNRHHRRISKEDRRRKEKHRSMGDDSQMTKTDQNTGPASPVTPRVLETDVELEKQSDIRIAHGSVKPAYFDYLERIQQLHSEIESLRVKDDARGRDARLFNEQRYKIEQSLSESTSSDSTDLDLSEESDMFNEFKLCRSKAIRDISAVLETSGDTTLTMSVDSMGDSTLSADSKPYLETSIDDFLPILNHNGRKTKEDMFYSSIEGRLDLQCQAVVTAECQPTSCIYRRQEGHPKFLCQVADRPWVIEPVNKRHAIIFDDADRDIFRTPSLEEIQHQMSFDSAEFFEATGETMVTEHDGEGGELDRWVSNMLDEVIDDCDSS